MPTFCRHNRLVQNCPICAREQEVEMRPVVTPGGRPEPRSRPAAERPPSARASSGSARGAGRARGSGAMTVRRMAREADDGYGSVLVPGIHSGASAERLAEELAFAQARLQQLDDDPPGLYAQIADGAQPREERTWLAVLTALLGPLESDEPFAAIARVHDATSWASGEAPEPTPEDFGPRGVGTPERARRICDAYRAWAGRQGSQEAGLEGEPTWTPERRFDRAFERLGTLASMDRIARYDLLVTLGRLGVYELHGARLHVGGNDPVTVAAKRILGIGDPLLLERRATELAGACGLSLEALDVGFAAWERRSRDGAGVDPDLEPDPAALAGARAALGLD